jgi:hypothetical protein
MQLLFTSPNAAINSDLAFWGNHAFIGYYTGDNAPSGGVRIFDISDPANPVQIATFEMPTTRQADPDRPGDFTVHDPKVRGNTLYLSWYAEGVVVLDISDPRNPELEAQFLPPPAEDPFGLFVPAQVNVWGVALDRNVVLASDMSSGLWIFKLDRSAS